MPDNRSGSKQASRTKVGAGLPSGATSLMGSKGEALQHVTDGLIQAATASYEAWCARIEREPRADVLEAIEDHARRVANAATREDIEDVESRLDGLL